MATVSSTSALSLAVKDTVPLKLRFADDGSLTTASDTCSGEGPDHSDSDEDRTSQDLAAEPWPVEIGAPPGLGLDMGAIAPPKRTPLRSQAAVYAPTPLRSQAGEFVPKGLALAGGTRSASQPSGGTDPKAPAWTTVMMRNLPLSYTCDMLVGLLESKGFSKWFDFVYVPINFSKMLGVGYGFVNLTSPERAEEFILAFDGFDGWASSFSKEACAMHWSVCQGLSENISRYRNSPLMCEDVPAFYKPVLLEDGVRIPFPKPTKQLRTLRCRKAKGEEGEA